MSFGWWAITVNFRKELGICLYCMRHSDRRERGAYCAWLSLVELCRSCTSALKTKRPALQEGPRASGSAMISLRSLPTEKQISRGQDIERGVNYVTFIRLISIWNRVALWVDCNGVSSVALRVSFWEELCGCSYAHNDMRQQIGAGTTRVINELPIVDWCGTRSQLLWRTWWLFIRDSKLNKHERGDENNADSYYGRAFFGGEMWQSR